MTRTYVAYLSASLVQPPVSQDILMLPLLICVADRGLALGQISTGIVSIWLSPPHATIVSTVQASCQWRGL